ncbi:host-nuclease inhibitor Gam family protein [Gudongella sp. SC589]|uniref:host-nuclease inhibitor Gam family protein n=1 Tax=Gudongella sp. SC589 TaxID=3385990 RepID=UPI003904CE72
MLDYIKFMDLTEEEQEERWRITNDAEAEWLIDKVNEELYEISRYEISLINKIEVLKEKLEKVRNEKENKIARRDSYLLEYFETLDDKAKKKTKTQEKYRLPSGEIVKKYPSPEYKRDNDTLVKWVKGSQLNDYIEVKESVKWADLKKNTQIAGGQLVYKDTGEIVDGVEVVDRPPTLEFKEV